MISGPMAGQIDKNHKILAATGKSACNRTAIHAEIHGKLSIDTTGISLVNFELYGPPCFVYYFFALDLVFFALDIVIHCEKGVGRAETPRLR